MDANNKKPLFTKEDFEKGSNEKKQIHLQKYWKRYLGGGIIAACLIGLLLFWSKGKGEFLPLSSVDTFAQVVDSPAIVKNDSVTNVVKIRSVNEGVGKIQDEASTETPKMTDKPKVNTVTESILAGNTRSRNVTVDAKKAIRGDFGNGVERRRQLGNDYEQVQALVNKMYRDGNLHW